MLVARKQIAARDQPVGVVEHLFGSAINIALRRERILIRGPVAAEASLALVPSVMRSRAVGELHRATMEVETVNTRRRIRAEPAPVSNASQLFLIARSDIDVGALRQVRGPRDDVDHSIHRVGAPKRRADAADHLDAIDVLQHHIERVGVDPENNGV